jgi:hypothetical protein
VLERLQKPGGAVVADERSDAVDASGSGRADAQAHDPGSGGDQCARLTGESPQVRGDCVVGDDHPFDTERRRQGGAQRAGRRGGTVQAGASTGNGPHLGHTERCRGMAAPVEDRLDRVASIAEAVQLEIRTVASLSDQADPRLGLTEVECEFGHLNTSSGPLAM